MAGGASAGVRFTLDGYRCLPRITSPTLRRDGMSAINVSSITAVSKAFG